MIGVSGLQTTATHIIPLWHPAHVALTPSYCYCPVYMHTESRIYYAQNTSDVDDHALTSSIFSSSSTVTISSHSPLSIISFTISSPPTNSPLTMI